MDFVNIFLGGSGKYIAEELKGTSLYYDIEMPPFLAFDVNSGATHSGTFALDVGSDLLTIDQKLPEYAKKTVAPAWAALDEGRQLVPDPDRAGPSLRPEASVIRRIGHDALNNPEPDVGLWAMRELGLLAFHSFMDPHAPGSSATFKSAFENRVREALQQAAAKGGGVTVNLVASTAGGTGAGIFLPLALWLRAFARQTPGVGEINVSLVLFWWSTFVNEPFEGVSKDDIISKAKCGSYGILRELQLLDFGSTLPDLPRFPERHYQFGVDGLDLRYRLNSNVFNRIYWIGRRPTDVTATKLDVYAEGSRLAQLLSIPSVVEMMRADTGNYSQRLVVAVTSVDYPRLRVAQRLSGGLVETAMEQLIGSDDDPAGAVSLSDQGGSQPNALEAFFRAETNAALSRDKAGATNADRDRLDQLVESISKNCPLRAIDRGEQLMDGGHGIEDPAKWQEYCLTLKAGKEGKGGLEAASADRRVEVQRAARALANDTAARFRTWLSRDYLASRLNPTGDDRTAASLTSITKGLGLISKDVDAVDTFFSIKSGISGRVPDSKDWRYQPTNTIQDEITKQYDEVLNPRASGGAGLTPIRWLSVILGLVAVSLLAWDVTDAVLDGSVHLLASVGAGLAFAILLFVLLRRSTSLADRRRAAEDQLFDLYEALAYRQAADALSEAVHSLYVTIARRDLLESQTQIGNLRKVYDGLLGEARTRRTLAEKKPLHCVEQIGFDLNLEPSKREELASKLVQRVRVTPEISNRREGIDLRLEIRGLAPVRGVTGQVALLAEYLATKATRQMGEPLGQRDFEAIDKTLDDLGIAVLGNKENEDKNLLPRTFEEALIADGKATEAARAERVAELLRTLMHRDGRGRRLATPDRREPSIPINDQRDRVFQVLLVPDAPIRSLVDQAIAGFGDDAIAQELRALRQGTEVPVVEQIGPSIVTLTVYSADDLFALGESVEAMKEYYGANPNGEQQSAFSQRAWNFQILPEVAAAASIELKDRVVTPLHPIVVSRLLGCDPTTKGPSLLELFYLLREDSTLTIEREGASFDQRLVARLHPVGRDSVRLYSEQPLEMYPDDDPFGNGRSIVNAYDAFTEFMLFNGGSGINTALLENRQVAQLPHGAELHVDDWRTLGEKAVGDIQRAIVEKWWTPPEAYKGDEYVKAIQKWADDDRKKMNRGARQPDPRSVGESWYRAVRVLGEVGRNKRDPLRRSATESHEGEPATRGHGDESATVSRKDDL